VSSTEDAIFFRLFPCANLVNRAGHVCAFLGHQRAKCDFNRNLAAVFVQSVQVMPAARSGRTARLREGTLSVFRMGRAGTLRANISIFRHSNFSLRSSVAEKYFLVPEVS